ncbi:Hypothetical protein PP7435_CHR2-0069 [Komagataella phaffii CBS 7435]|uniref:Uncharacterized protein n=2 Tax=Komagataella phaffii TaxID=460519 RepID=C4R2Z4_KOMPG|nr:uncharacterized protein PAS_chr2-2_0454 [Komagataella phaffii GS115]AOA62805.1 GQ67_01285T0 [Komagataella phaffii]CAH2447575.1 Hypothetical protein BQ9382_C2-0355 [Komagataella phaffii CBS 7435]AOA67284.1 GQ68_00105T0 [Komagataella phaffii GS115]CAY69868.1 hypothetical protein PAS_chr2-2_0454 [Komagataella phaffii GS115]CCA37766.1 Hypothetical protein PP7435_CHR2-0069 [Komagataella phaffii CBS 7435]
MPNEPHREPLEESKPRGEEQADTDLLAKLLGLQGTHSPNTITQAFSLRLLQEKTKQESLRQRNLELTLNIIESASRVGIPGNMISRLLVPNESSDSFGLSAPLHEDVGASKESAVPGGTTSVFRVNPASNESKFHFHNYSVPDLERTESQKRKTLPPDSKVELERKRQSGSANTVYDLLESPSSSRSQISNPFDAARPRRSTRRKETDESLSVRDRRTPSKTSRELSSVQEESLLSRPTSPSTASQSGRTPTRPLIASPSQKHAVGFMMNTPKPAKK